MSVRRLYDRRQYRGCTMTRANKSGGKNLFTSSHKYRGPDGCLI